MLNAIQEGFDCLESVNGFNGELWACEDEWENNDKLRYFMYTNVHELTDNDDTCENFIIAAYDKDEAHELFKEEMYFCHDSYTYSVIEVCHGKHDYIYGVHELSDSEVRDFSPIDE